MTCFYCKGDMEPSKTTYMEELENCIVIIKNVPCQKCKQCGETVFDGKTVAQIEKITEQITSVVTEIAIVNYPDDVA